MKNILSILIIVACLISMGMNIEREKKRLKEINTGSVFTRIAFITGCVLTWMAIKFFKKS